MTETLVKTHRSRFRLLTSETLTAVLVGTDDIKLEDREAFDLVTDLANLANLLKPSNNTSYS